MIARTTVMRVALAAAAVLASVSAGLADGPQAEIKWSQPIVRLMDVDPAVTDPALIYGWDQVSQGLGFLVADDFRCNDPRPVTDIHWWGSYVGYQAGDVLQHPDAFLIRFWTDVPAGADPDMQWSHPGQVIHEILCANYQVSADPVGQDINVYMWQAYGETIVMDDCYQYNQTLDPTEYFNQEFDTIYWLSIQAIYDEANLPGTSWGWKTRPNYFNDDAVMGTVEQGQMFLEDTIRWDPIQDYQGNSWDTAFELSVPEPATLALMGLGAVAFLVRRRRRG